MSGRSGGVAAGEHIRFWFDAALGASGVELLSGSFLQHRFDAHFHDEYVVAAFTGGAQAHRVGRHRGVAGPGSVMIIPPGEAHSGEAADRSGWAYRAFYVDTATLAEIGDEVHVGSEGREVGFAGAPLHDDSALAGRLAALHGIIEDQGSEPLLRQQAFGVAMAAVVRRFADRSAATRGPAGRPAISRTIELAREHYPDPQLGIRVFADAVGVSPFHLMRSFHASTGITIHGLVLQLRLDAARRLLRSGCPAAEVAAAVGFYDQSHLIRRFRRAFGLTPGKYVAMSRN